MLKRFSMIALFGFLFSMQALWAAEVIFTNTEGRTLTDADVRRAKVMADWEVEAQWTIPKRAIALHAKGRDLAKKGEYALAIPPLEQAAEAAPHWAAPLYDAGFTYLLQRDTPKALQAYEQALAIAPRGFFTVITAVDTLKKEVNGELPQGTYLKYLSLDWSDDVERKQQLEDELLAAAPNYAPAWKAKALLEPDDAKRLELLEKGLAANPDADIQGFLLVEKALVLVRKGQQAQAVEILGNLALDRQTPSRVELLAKTTLADILDK